MNLKDYDDAELFDEDQVEEEYAEEYEEEYEDIPNKRGKRKKGYGGFVVVVILLVLAVFAGICALYFHDICVVKV
ncbi:MAG: hypothetical protein J6P78_02770 [Lachnospiraceae bacterium]|nr:hypothetical protein [Lachnospiraceae bacterium]